jgi:hypothetical protein
MSEKTVFALFENLLALERLSAEGVNKALTVGLMLGIAPSTSTVTPAGTTAIPISEPSSKNWSFAFLDHNLAIMMGC